MTQRRRANSHQRAKMRARLAAMGEPCHICGLPIDYSLDWFTDPTDGKRKRHPCSFEWDHDVPQSLGGDDSIDNAKPAHRICNQRKGNRLEGRHRPPGAACGSPEGARPSRDWRRL